MQEAKFKWIIRSICVTSEQKNRLDLIKKCQPKCVTYVRRKVHPFEFIIILDLFTSPKKTSAINEISPVIRDNCMHWLKTFPSSCSTFQRFLFFSSSSSYQVSFSVHSLSGGGVKCSSLQLFTPVPKSTLPSPLVLLYFYISYRRLITGATNHSYSSQLPTTIMYKNYHPNYF